MVTYSTSEKPEPGMLQLVTSRTREHTQQGKFGNLYMSVAISPSVIHERFLVPPRPILYSRAQSENVNLEG